MTVAEVTLPESEPLKEEFLDSNFWKVEHLSSSIDDLLAEMTLE